MSGMTQQVAQQPIDKPAEQDAGEAEKAAQEPVERPADKPEETAAQQADHPTKNADDHTGTKISDQHDGTIFAADPDEQPAEKQASEPESAKPANAAAPTDKPSEAAAASEPEQDGAKPEQGAGGPEFGVAGLVCMAQSPNGFCLWQWSTPVGSLDETKLDPAAEHMRSGDAIYVVSGRDVIHRRVVVADSQVHVLPIN